MKQAQEISQRFKIRCSGIGQIMTNGRAKDSLGKTAQTFALNWIREQPEFYNRRKEFQNRYTDKGHIMEDEALDFVSDHLYNGKLLVKNEEYFENDFLKGTPDNIQKDHIIDVKNSWDFSTFPLFETELPTKDYFYQGQGYMNLTGRKGFKVIYCLLDTPANLIESEAWNYSKRNGLGQPDDDLIMDFYERMTYKDIDPKLRLKVFEFEYDQAVIDSIQKRVEEIRQFIFDKLNSL